MPIIFYGHWPFKSTYYTFILLSIYLFSSLTFGFIYLSGDQWKNPTNHDQIILSQSLANVHHLTELIEKQCSAQKPYFTKMVFIVIDALRSDFIPSVDKNENLFSHNTMPFLESLINNGIAIGAVSRANTPTVTTPRLKALLSGTESRFLDILTNLDANKLVEDNIVFRGKAANKRMIFYGDDTWLNMFDKQLFVRTNITYSLFATDYIQTDTNVTENALLELDRTQEWDYMFLHYLGVDHIGHSYGGAFSSLMKPKLLEMDLIVQTIFDKMSKANEPCLIVVTGDHGMTDLGNHGGSTDEESNTAAIFISTHKKPDEKHETVKIRQSDISVLVSTLLGLKNPNLSKGRVSLPIINFLEPKTQIQQFRTLCYLYANARTLQKSKPEIALQFWHLFQKAIELHSANFVGRDAFFAYDSFLHVIEQSFFQREDQESSLIIFYILWIIGILCLAKMFYIMILYIKRFEKSCFFSLETFIRKKKAINFAIFGSFLHLFLLSSTSYIEMEHHYWPFITVTCWLILIKEHFFFKTDPHVYPILLLLFMLRNWPGNEESIFSYLAKQENRYSSFLQVLISISYLTFKIIWMDKNLMKNFFFFLAFLLVVLIKSSVIFECNSFMHFVSITRTAQSVYLISLILILNSIFKTWKKGKFLFDFGEVFILILCLISRPINLGVISIQVWLENKVASLLFNNKQSNFLGELFVYHCMSLGAFFSMGSTNSISTLDMGPGFTALSEYNLSLVTVQVLLNTYGILIYWIIQLFARVKVQLKPKSDKLKAIYIAFLIVRLISFSIYQILAIHFRNHLFIWSVICPKLLYELALTILYAFFFTFFHVLNDN